MAISGSLNFLSASEFGSYMKPASDGNRRFGLDKNSGLMDGSTRIGHIPTDFVGMNTNIYEPTTTTASANFLGYPASYGDQSYVNAGNEGNDTVTNAAVQQGGFINVNYQADDVSGCTISEGCSTGYILNSLLLHRNGPYGHPMWKQYRGGDHPVARYFRRNNKISIDTNNPFPSMLENKSSEFSWAKLGKKFNSTVKKQKENRFLEKDKFADMSNETNINSSKELSTTYVENTNLKQFYEPVLVTKYKPFTYGVSIPDFLALKYDFPSAGIARQSLMNQMTFFTNPGLNNDILKIASGDSFTASINDSTSDEHTFRRPKHQYYSLVKAAKAEGAFSFIYAERIYPRSINAYRGYKLKRPNYEETDDATQVLREGQSFYPHPNADIFGTWYGGKTYDRRPGEKRSFWRTLQGGGNAGESSDGTTRMRTDGVARNSISGLGAISIVEVEDTTYKSATWGPTSSYQATSANLANSFSRNILWPDAPDTSWGGVGDSTSRTSSFIINGIISNQQGVEEAHLSPRANDAHGGFWQLESYQPYELSALSMWPLDPRQDIYDKPGYLTSSIGGKGLQIGLTPHRANFALWGGDADAPFLSRTIARTIADSVAGLITGSAGELVYSTKPTLFFYRTGSADTDLGGYGLGKASPQYLRHAFPYNSPFYATNKIRGIDPFHNSYEDFFGSIKYIGKDYTIVPEYNITDQMMPLLEKQSADGIGQVDLTNNYGLDVYEDVEKKLELNTTAKLFLPREPGPKIVIFGDAYNYNFNNTHKYDFLDNPGAVVTSSARRDFPVNTNQKETLYKYLDVSDPEGTESLGLVTETGSYWIANGTYDTQSAGKPHWAEDMQAVKFAALFGDTDTFKAFSNLVSFDAGEIFESGRKTIPDGIMFRCHAIKKMRIKDGFYPVTRTVQLAKEFDEAFFQSNDHPTVVNGQLKTYDVVENNRTKIAMAKQAILEPLFGPGLLYNSIKSGIAVDWPLYAQSKDGTAKPPLYYCPEAFIEPRAASATITFAGASSPRVGTWIITDTAGDSKTYTPAATENTGAGSGGEYKCNGTAEEARNSLQACIVANQTTITAADLSTDGLTLTQTVAGPNGNTSITKTVDGGQSKTDFTGGTDDTPFTEDRFHSVVSSSFNYGGMYMMGNSRCIPAILANSPSHRLRFNELYEGLGNNSILEETLTFLPSDFVDLDRTGSIFSDNIGLEPFHAGKTEVANSPAGVLSGEMFASKQGDRPRAIKYHSSINNFLCEMMEFYLSDAKQSVKSTIPGVKFPVITPKHLYQYPFANVTKTDIMKKKKFFMEVGLTMGQDQVMCEGPRQAGIAGNLAPYAAAQLKQALGNTMRGYIYGPPMETISANHDTSVLQPDPGIRDDTPTNYASIGNSSPFTPTAYTETTLGKFEHELYFYFNLQDPAYQAYTPPYFYGDSSKILVYAPTSDVEDYKEVWAQATGPWDEDLHNIQAGAFHYERYNTGSYHGDTEALCLTYPSTSSISTGSAVRMKIDASVEISEAISITNRGDEEPSWHTSYITPWWMCPVLDFSSSYSAIRNISQTTLLDSGLPVPTKAQISMSVVNNTYHDITTGRGMWGGYGTDPYDKIALQAVNDASGVTKPTYLGDKGLYLTVKDIFVDQKEQYKNTIGFVNEAMGETPSDGFYTNITATSNADTTGSLTKGLGFAEDRYPIGQIATGKTVHEAIVVIPYLEEKIHLVPRPYQLSGHKEGFKLGSTVNPYLTGTPGQLAGADKFPGKELYSTREIIPGKHFLPIHKEVFNNILSMLLVNKYIPEHKRGYGNSPKTANAYWGAPNAVRFKENLDTIMKTDVGKTITQVARELDPQGNNIHSSGFQLPPEFDFVYNKHAQPFQMIIIPFEHTFGRQDMLDMYQGIMPRISRYFEKDDSTKPISPNAKTPLIDNDVPDWVPYVYTGKVGDDYLTSYYKEIWEAAKLILVKMGGTAKVFWQKIFAYEDEAFTEDFEGFLAWYKAGAAPGEEGSDSGKYTYYVAEWNCKDSNGDGWCDDDPSQKAFQVMSSVAYTPKGATFEERRQQLKEAIAQAEEESPLTIFAGMETVEIGKEYLMNYGLENFLCPPLKHGGNLNEHLLVEKYINMDESIYPDWLVSDSASKSFYENLRFMVFKVKQRATKNYSNYRKKQIHRVLKESMPEKQIDDQHKVVQGDEVLENVTFGEVIGSNWPYDYFSLLETIKIDIEIKVDK